jgi:hypothetical protein
MLIDNRIMRYVSSVLLLAALATNGATAATVEKDKEKDAPTVYHLEVVLFRNSAQALADERWPEIFGTDTVDRLVHVTSQPVAPIPSATPAVAPPASAAGGKPAAPAPAPAPDWFHFLGQRDFRLSGSVAKLARMPGHEVLLHTAWLQPAFDYQESAAAYLFDGMLFPEHEITESASPFVTTPVDQEPESPEFHPPRFSGTIKLAAGRYLHVALDVLLRDIAQSNESVDAEGNLVEYPRNVIQGYRLNETRRVRIGEVHYFDHPAIGALVLVAATEKKRSANVEKETVGDAPIPTATPDD